MDESLIWISGASSGIGKALAETVPWPNSRVIGISRRPSPTTEHLAADLSDPQSWASVEESFDTGLNGFVGRAVFVHAAGTIEPVGFVGEVDSAAYRANVLLNSAAPQVLGEMFLTAAHRAGLAPTLAILTSGAARSVYAGWASYGASKAAVDQWVRDVGAEQAIRGGARVLAIAPGTVATDMQAILRGVAERDFPHRQKFIDLHASGGLANTVEVAASIWDLIDGDLETGSVVDLRDLSKRY